MKLYYSRGACSLGPRIVINELGLKCDYESVDLKSKKTETGQDFTEINIKGSVPVLITDQNETLTEAAVILQYLAHVGKNTEVLPPESDFMRFRVLEALNYVATEMHKGVGILFSTAFTQELKNEIFIPIIHTKLKYLNKKLEKTKYLVRDSFTLPDAYLFVILTWVMHFHIDVQAYPHVIEYFKRMKERPAVIKSMQEEGLMTAKA